MAQFQRHFVQELTKPLIVRQCGDLGFTGDNLSDVISVDLYTDGVAYSGGGTCAGACICPDGSTVALSGSVSGKTASVTLKEDCFAIPGQIGIGIRITTGTTKTTVLKCIYNVDLFATNNPVDPGSRITLDVGDLVNRIDAATADIPASDMASLMAGIAPTFSTTTVYPAGAYVYYNGTLYRFTSTHAAGSWAGTDATAVALGNDVSELRNSSDNLVTLLDAEGKNLLNPVWLANLVRGNDPLYTLNGDSVTVEWSDYSPVTASDKIMVLDAGTYTISFENSCRCGIFVNGTKIEDFTGTSKTFTVANDNSNVYLLFLASSYPYVIGHIQIEHGSTATAYVPYGLFTDSIRLDNDEERISDLENNASLKSTMQSRFSGKKLSIIGDSIDTFDQEGYKIDGYAMYYPTLDVTDVDQTWWKRVMDNSSMVMEVNASYSGSRVTNTQPSYPDFYARVSLIGNPDVIFVTLGTNDSLNSVALGNYDFTTEYTSLSESTFRTAYIKGVKALKVLHPSAKIVCITEKMNERYRESVEYIAKELSVEYINAGDYLAEGAAVHPGAYGMRQIASHVMYPTDKNFWQDNIPADANAVGDKLSLIDNYFDGISGILDAGGKNLLNPEWLADCVRGNDPIYTLNGDSVTVQWSDYSAVTSTDGVMALDAGTYTISLENSTRCIVYANGSAVADFTGTSRTFTISNDNTMIYIRFLPSSYPFVIGHIQIERGSTATAYVPYGPFLDSVRLDSYGKRIDDLEKAVYPADYNTKEFEVNSTTFVKGNLQSDGSYNSSGIYIVSPFLPINKSDYVHVETSGYRFWLFWYTASRRYISRLDGWTNDNTDVQTIGKASYCRILIECTDSVETFVGLPNNKIYSAYKRNKANKKLLFDTDMDLDVDDAVALRCAVWANRIKSVDLIGVLLSVNGSITEDNTIYGSASYIDAMLNYDGTPDIPIARNSHRSGHNCWFILNVVKDFYHTVTTNDTLPEVVDFYRAALESLPDGEKTDICICGYLNNLAELITSEADEYINKTGIELINEHVGTIYIMGGDYPASTSSAEGNFANGAGAVANTNIVLTANIDNPIIFLGRESGWPVQSGGSLENMTYDPLHISLKDYNHGTFAPRSSYDPLTTLIACLGNDKTGFNLTRGTNTINTDSSSAQYGYNTFTANSTGHHYYVSYRYSSMQYYVNLINTIIVKHAWP